MQTEFPAAGAGFLGAFREFRSICQYLCLPVYLVSHLPLTTPPCGRPGQLRGTGGPGDENVVILELERMKGNSVNPLRQSLSSYF